MDQDRAQSSMMATRNPLSLPTQWKVDQSREFTLKVRKKHGWYTTPQVTIDSILPVLALKFLFFFIYGGD